MSYCELHTHGSYSHDGFSSAKQAVTYAKSLGHVALARTDHGNMMGAVELEAACREGDIKPIFGCEIYYQPTFQKDVKASKKDGIEAMRTKRYHLTLIAKTQQGYRNLSSLLTKANESRFYYFPIVTQADLEAYHDGLIVLSGCISSYLSQAILALDFESATSYIETMVSIFGRDFYLEVQPIEVPTQEGEMPGAQGFINDILWTYSDQYGIPMVITSDAHYPSPEYYQSFLVAHAMRKHRDPIADYASRFFHTHDDMSEMWQTMMGGDGTYFLEESGRIAQSTNVAIARPIQMPPILWTQNANQALTDICQARLQRLADTRPLDLDIYQARLAHELAVFIKKGFSEYMLLGYQIADYCACHGILMAARGSACGSLVVYLLGISKIDPIKYGTVFDRFFSEERSNWPDIDYDIEALYRDAVIDFLEGMYPNRSARIVNVNTWQTRNLMNDLAKHFGLGSLAKEMAIKALEDMGYDESPVDYQTLLHNRILADIEREMPDLFKHFVALHGTMTHIGKHASGLVITRDPIETVMPLIRQSSTGRLLTSFSKDEAEIAGGMKLDLLAVSALTTIKEAERYAGIKFQEADLDDNEIYQAFARSNTCGVFQFSSREARQMLREGKPVNLADIAAITALNRPVPKAEGSLQTWLDGRNGKANTASIIYQYTTDTYGSLVFQEQVMRVCQELAHMTRRETDKVLKMLKHYQEDKPELHLRFVEGCQESGVSFQEAEHLWQTIRRYLFCMAHAFSYAYIAARQMNVKLCNPYAWYLALLQQETDSKKIKTYCADALSPIPAKRVYFLPPHVNGGINFTGEEIDGRNYIRFGLSTIDGIGPTVAEAIYQERQANGLYTSLDDLAARVPKRIVNSARMIVLAQTGAADFDPVTIKARIKLLNNQLIAHSRFER